MPYAYVYIVTNRRYGTLYVGVTNNLIRRADEHRRGAIAGFSKEHRLHRLVWYEPHEWIVAAIEREKRIKRWHRDWKINLIQSFNPGWADLYPLLF